MGDVQKPEERIVNRNFAFLTLSESKFLPLKIASFNW